MKNIQKKLSKIAVAIPPIGQITDTKDPKIVVAKAIEYALFFVGAIALVFVIWGGVQFITAGGDAEKVTKARNTLLYAILGVIVVVLAYAIVRWATVFPETGI